jgi:Domain of unknown function (DUF1929)/Bacterial Ig domain/Galactose oxidase, central domain
MAGDLNVVIVGWGDSTTHVKSVTDTLGNTYRLGVGPTVLAGQGSQSMYYASNIKGGTNTVTVTFDAAAANPDIRILEYSGIASSNPVDVTAAHVGSSTISSTDTVTTTNPMDLLVGGNIVGAATTSPGANFTAREITSPNANIAEDRVVQVAGRYSANAILSGGCTWVMQMIAFRAASNPPPDTTPPTVSITAPTAGASLTGTTAITINASDTGTGVAGVQLQIDGLIFGTAVTSSPYTFNVNTARFSNGAHTLTASAWDFANNTASASPVSVTFSNSNPGTPAQSGVMSGTFPLPIVSVHSMLLPGPKILMYDGQAANGEVAIVWNPITNAVDWVPEPANAFCGGMNQMADGRIFTAGGHIVAHNGLAIANIFDPATESWTVLPQMAQPRWYPTVTALSDGRFIVNSGETNCADCDVAIPEIYNPSTNSWSQLSSAPFAFPYYPYVYQLPDGRVLVAGTQEHPIVSQVLDLNTLTWTPVGGSTALEGGSSAMYLPNKILKSGTSIDPDVAATPSVATAYVLDMTQTTPAWRQVASMAFPRTYHTITVLPDGNVLVTGGGTTTGAVDVAHAVAPVELWSPVTETWTTLASMGAPRLYHSEALLLPDGRVEISGSGRYDDLSQSVDQFNVEFFAPPYLFKGSRPVITSAPSQLSYGQNFSIQTPDAARIAKVSLIRFGSVTHTFNMSQRFIPLSFSVGAGSLTVTAPVDANLATGGNYMLFIVDNTGVPSVAAIVHF